MGNVARHPRTKKLYAFNHALNYYTGPVRAGTSYLYELMSNGIERKIGALKAPTGTYPFPEDGISNSGICFSEDGNTLFGLGDAGTARRNQSLMLIDQTTGAAASYAKNLGGDAVPLTDISPNCLALAIHPETKAMYTVWTEDSTSSLPTRPPFSWGFGTIDQITGELTKGPSLGLRSATGYVTGIAFERQVNGDVWAYCVAYDCPQFRGKSGFMRCKDITAAVPTFDNQVPAIGMIGFATGSETLFGIAAGH